MQNIELNVKRTAVSSRNCTNPFCENKNELRRATSKIRYELIVKKRLFVPSRAMVCSHHSEYLNWSNILLIDIPQRTFNAEQIEDMVDLLRSNSIFNQPAHAGEDIKEE